MRHHVDYGLVERRAKSVSSEYDSHDCKLYLERAVESTKKNSNTRQRDVDRFFSECMNPSNANTYYKYCLEFIAEEEDPKYAKSLTEKFTDRILPYIKNVEWVSHILPRYAMSFHENSMIEHAVEQYKSCDCILNDHAYLQEKSDIDSVVESYKGKGTHRLSLKICSIVDENSVGFSPCQKLATSLEETSYVLQKHGIKYNAQELVKYVTEYYLTKKGLSGNDRYACMNVLAECSMINDTDLGMVGYLYEDSIDYVPTIINMLNNFIKSEDKDLDKDFGAVIRTMPIGYIHQREEFVNTFGNILLFIKDYMLTDDYDIKQIVEILNTIPKNVMSQMKNDTWLYTRDELDTLIMHYNNAIEAIDVDLADYPDKERVSKLIALKDCYSSSIEKIANIRDVCYTDEVINRRNLMIEAVFSPKSHAYYLEEFKVFKFQNLISAAVEADKFIKGKGKKLMDKIAGKITPIRKKILKETEVLGTLTEYNTSDICVCSYKILDESDFYQVHDIMTEVCEQLNKNVFGEDSEIKAYYVVNPDTVEVHLEGYSTVILSNDEEEEKNDTFSDEDMMRTLELDEMAKICDSFDVDAYGSIVSTIESSIKDIDAERFSSIIEASQYVDPISTEDIAHMHTLYVESHVNDSYTESSNINGKINNWNYQSAPLELQMEACNIILSLLESDEQKKAINKKKEEENNKKSIKDKIKEKIPDKDEKDDKVKMDRPDESGKKDPHNPFSGVNLASLKLYANGIKAKMKDLSSKEKEWSKTLDMEFNRLYSSCKNALVSDRREAIIKGSIIPSFSRCIKFGIAIAGLTAINPVASAATVVGGVAMSKHLTKKERLLLLDEITTELEVVEKEISIAERNDNMKKYRKLLTYKKDLQRQYQRIKYNTRIGKDLMPDSNIGVAGGND
jgi:hypothetical protein